jgi:hypothetical protein
LVAFVLAVLTLVGPGSGDAANRPGSHQAGFLRLRPASSVCMVLMVIADGYR